ncbi:MATH domain-containing protein [Endozoicomonas numazuensis]|uniref:MATH domain-containing protein n=1 Tax=Endozoicomonas numazuensis TaxID=1137799 RepID=UPI001F3E91DF|nr:MATH domain-containing protein [Endozoicomonas numazuensis]
MTSGASDTTIIIMDLNDDALPKGLNSGRYALTKTNEPGLVMAFHSEVKSCGIDQFPPDQQKLITPKIDFCDKQASVEVKVMQQDGSIMLASMKPLFQAVVTDSPSYSHKHTAHEQPLSKPDESIAFEDKAIGKSLKSAMSSSTWYLIDVNRNKMYPLLNQKLKQDNTHFTVSLDSELLDDWAMELNEREKELKVAKLTQRVSQLEESAKQGEAEQLILDQSLAKNQKFVNALMQDVKSLKLQMAEFMSNTSPWSSPFQAQQIGYLESSLLELQNDAFELGRLVEILQATSYNGQFTWKIPEVIRRRQEAVNGRTLSLYSAPFYSSRFGYKMCLRVYLNGDGSGKNTHISLFFTIMRGEYDDLLPWPFNQRVTLRLVDSTGQRRHITERFMPDTTSSSFQKPKKYPSADMNRASGMPKFVRIDEVFGINGHFINDNNIYFKAIIDLTNLPDLTD